MTTATAHVGSNGTTSIKKGKTVAKVEAAGAVQIVIPKMDIRTMKIKLIGDSPLVCHAWSEKAKKQMRDKQMKVAKTGREAKDPRADFLGSLYIIESEANGDPKRCGFPAIGFKAAAVDACSFIEGVTKVLARGAFHVIGELVEIKGDKPVMREDMVRVGMGVADLRYRGEFTNWHCEVTVRYNAAVLSPEQVVNLFNTAGFAVGVGERRPQKDGSWGCFHVARDGE